MRDRAIGLAVVHRRSVRPLRRIHQDIARAIESEPLVSARGGVALDVLPPRLARSGFGEAGRQYVQGDASTRAYERLTLDGASYILMNSPKRPDGPPVHDGKPYSAIAHLAENVTPVSYTHL